MQHIEQLWINIFLCDSVILTYCFTRKGLGSVATALLGGKEREKDEERERQAKMQVNESSRVCLLFSHTGPDIVEPNFSTTRPHTLLTNTQHVPRQTTNIKITSVHSLFAVSSQVVMRWHCRTLWIWKENAMYVCHHSYFKINGGICSSFYIRPLVAFE